MNMNALTRWQNAENSSWPTFGRLLSLRDQLDSLFANPLGEWSPAQVFSAWSPALDVYQDKDNVTVHAELPGMKKEEIQVALQDGVLTISGERKSSRNSEDTTIHRTERFEGSFQRSISLPAEVKADKVAAQYKNGVLTITLPKAEAAKPKTIEVKVS
jgi:HSP20 family protein